MLSFLFTTSIGGLVVEVHIFLMALALFRVKFSVLFFLRRAAIGFGEKILGGLLFL